MTIRAQLYGVLRTTADALVRIQEHLIDHPEIDPDDELFDEAQRTVQAIIPVLQRLHAEPALPATVADFLADLERSPEAR